MLFKPDMAELIMQKKKTATRRMPGKLSYAAGSIQPVQTTYTQKAVCRIKILRTYRQFLGDVTLQQAREEGFETVSAFKAYFMKCFKKVPITFLLAPEIVVYEFRLLDEEAY